MNEVQQEIYEWIERIKKLVDEGYELGDRVGALSFSCLTTEVPENLPELLNCGQTIEYPHTFSWSTQGLQSGSMVDIWINGVDAGTAVLGTDGQFTVASGPSGIITVDMYEILTDGSFSVVSSCQFNASQPASDLVSLKEINIDPDNKDPLALSDWQSSLSSGYVFFTGDVGLTSTVNGALRVQHPAGQANDLCTVCAINDTNKEKYRSKQTMTFAPNWTPGQTVSTQGGKAGWGLSGGSYVTSGGFNVIVSGGSSATTGWSIRPAFVGYELTGYAYYSNRPGMPTTGQLFGEGLYTGVTIVPGQSYVFEIEVCLNTPGNADGEIRIFVNDSVTPKAVRTNVLFMDGTPETSRAFFCSNHGGAGAQWAPDEDTYIEYADVSYLVSTV